MRLERGDRKGESGDVGDEMHLSYINPETVNLGLLV